MHIGDYPEYLRARFLRNQVAADAGYHQRRHDEELESSFVRTPAKTGYEDKMRKKTPPWRAVGTVFGILMEVWSVSRRHPRCELLDL